MIFDSIHYEINEMKILRGVYLNIPNGKICSLFGPNGSGKSTLIKIGAGLLLPTAGTVFIDGESFMEKRLLDRYKKIACLNQDSFLPRDISVLKFINNLPDNSHDFISKHYSVDLLHKKIDLLSTGERRLLELLFVLSLDRMYLLIDEPFTGIEPLIIEKMSALLLEQRHSGKGILITDHIL